MLENRGPVTQYLFDFSKWRKTQDEEMGIILREGVRLWLRTVLITIQNAPFTVGDSFPIQTGAAKGALVPLGRKLHVAVPMGVAPGRKDKSAEGAASSDFEIRDDRSHPLSFLYNFSWSTSLEHWAVLEVSHHERVRSITPWHAVEAADNALDLYLHYEIPRRLRKFVLNKWIQAKKGR